jgi:hypothetical protein
MTLTSDLSTAAIDADSKGLRGASTKQINFLASLMARLDLDAAAAIKVHDQTIPLTSTGASTLIGNYLDKVKALPPEAKPTVDVDLSAIVTLMTDAKASIKWPKIRFEDADIRMTLSGDRAKVPGAVNVTSNAGYGASVWYGRIMPDGSFDASFKITDTVKDFLTNLAADVRGTVKSHGSNTGNCCFCSRELTDEKSVKAGYGSVCAKTYSLPYGG